MKIILTGSLGNISKPLTKDLVQKGHSVTVITSTIERQKEIEALGAQAAIGSIENADFLTTAFTGADIVYCMETLGADGFFDQNLDIVAAIAAIGTNYKQAIQQAGVKKVVHLSSIGGHTDTGVGILKFHRNVENILRQLPDDVSIKFMRPVGFYINMFAFILGIKSKGAVFQNYGGDEKEPWVSPFDIAAAIAEEMEKPFNGRSIRYIASDEVSPNEVASALGEAIGKPDLKWVSISDEQMYNNLLAAGMSPQAASGFVEMNAGRINGTLFADYNLHKPILGNVKLKDFAKEFATKFNS